MTEALLVSPAWLSARLDDPNVVVVDGSWHMPASGRDAQAEFVAGHIPGAVRFDVDAISDPDTGLPHMLPSPARFAEMVGRLGVREDMTLVVYDTLGLFSAPRVRWTLRTFGARDVRILEGGLPAWKSEGGLLETGPSRRAPAVFDVTFDPAAVRDAEQVKRALAEASAKVVDARPKPRFSGDVAEPRPGLRAGHMPGARNVPFDALVAGGMLKPQRELAAIFDAAGVPEGGPTIATCGSGVTAAVVALALERIGRRDVSIYDGSWAEWGGREDCPVVTGPAA